MKKKKKILLALYIVFALIVVSVVASLWFLSDGGTSAVRSFICVKDGKILTPNRTVTAPMGEEVRIDVKFISNLTSESDDFDVYVYTVNTVETNFDFFVDAEKTNFSTLSQIDFAEDFNVSKNLGYFTFKIPENFSYEKLIESKYENKNVLISGIDCSSPLFEIVVASKDGKSVYCIPFVPHWNVDGIELDYSGYTFANER